MCRRIPVIDDSQEEREPNMFRPALLDEFCSLFSRLRPFFAQKRTFDRAMTMASAVLCSEAPHTITSAIIAAGEQDRDWTSCYNLFSHAKWESEEIFGSVFDAAEYHFLPGEPIPIAIDEGHIPKWGKKIPGVTLLRDPHSPAYRANLHLAQRYIQGSALISPEGSNGPSRGIPIGFQIAPPAKKPKKEAGEEEKANYIVESKEKSISNYCLKLMMELRWQAERAGTTCNHELVFVVDGSFTNKRVMRGLPEDTNLIGRVRKDIALYNPPGEHSGFGRRRKYGERIGTPEEIRRDKKIPWKSTDVFTAGKKHAVRYKHIAGVLWKEVTLDKPVMLIVIEPLAYRRSKRAKLLYRDPAYLIVSDPEMPPEEALQIYFRRWEIEVNHRDEKSIIGVGQPQVRNENSAYNVPQFMVAVYSLLLLASLSAYGPNRTGVYPHYPKWRNDERPRPSTADLRRQYQRELQQVGANTFAGFAERETRGQAPRKCQGLPYDIEGSENKFHASGVVQHTSPGIRHPN